MNKGLALGVILILVVATGSVIVWNTWSVNVPAVPSATDVVATTSDVEPSVVTNNSASSSEKPTCTLTSDKTEVQAGVEKYTVTWSSKNATFAIWNYPYDFAVYGNQEKSKLPPQGSESHTAFDGLTKKVTYYFYGPDGSTSCSVVIKIDPTRVIPSFPASLVKIETGGSVTSQDGKYSLTYVKKDYPNGVMVSVKTPDGMYQNVTIPYPTGSGQQNMDKTFGDGDDALNVRRCGGIGDGREEFTLSIGNDLLPACVSRMG
ncbi:MAG: hypothetical protein V1685_00225 [Parcubacteria group bacterium]